MPVGGVPDAFVTYMNAYGPSICANDAKVRVLNSCHSLFYHPEISEAARSLLPIASLNSATMFGAEITGRAYGGGMLKLEPREAGMLAVPSPVLVASCADDLRTVAPYVEKLLEKRDYDGAISLVDAVLIPRTSLQEVSLGLKKRSYIYQSSSPALSLISLTSPSKKSGCRSNPPGIFPYKKYPVEKTAYPVCSLSVRRNGRASGIHLYPRTG